MLSNGYEAGTERLPLISLTSEEIDSAKGILILLIVLAHSPIQHVVPHLRNILYSFHIHCFLFIPFLFPPKIFSGRFCIDRGIRYMVPYTVFVLLCCVLYLIFYVSGDEIIKWLQQVLIGLVTGNAGPLKQACGFRLYWFLPTLLSLNILRGAYEACGNMHRTVLLFSLIILHPFISLMPQAAKYYFPFGIHLTAFVFPLGVFIGFLWIRCLARTRRLIGVVALVGLIISIVVMICVGSNVTLYRLDVYSYKNPGLLILHDLIAVLACFAILGLTFLFVKLPIISFIGKRSMGIFVSHQIFMHGLLLISRKVGFHVEAPIAQFTFGFAIAGLATVLSLILSDFIYSNTLLQRMIFPKSSSDWLLLKSR